MPDATIENLKNAVTEFGEEFRICEYIDSAAAGKNFKIYICAEDPTVIFDICAQFGRLKSVKIEEVL